MGKEEQPETTKEHQSLYTLTPDQPPLRPEYYYIQSTPFSGKVVAR